MSQLGVVAGRMGMGVGWGGGEAKGKPGLETTRARGKTRAHSYCQRDERARDTSDAEDGR